MRECTASIVAYHNPPEMVRRAVETLLAGAPDLELHVVDNSSTAELERHLADLPVTYHYNGRNVGFGRAHNTAIQACSESRYHVIINPDIVVSPAAIRSLTDFMDAHPDVGAVCPKFLNEDGTVQRLNKRYPTVLDLFLRRFLPASMRSLFAKRLEWYENGDKGYDTIYDVESITGAFLFCRTAVLKRTGAFDPRYFLYFEDTDLGRTFQKLGYRTVYYPHAAVTHVWERAAHKSVRMTLVFIGSMIRYFNKWGWKFS